MLTTACHSNTDFMSIGETLSTWFAPIACRGTARKSRMENATENKSLEDAHESPVQKTEEAKGKKRKKLLKGNGKLEKTGVCYLSRVPPHMKPLKLRQLLSQYGEVLRIYLAPEDPAVRMRRRRAGGNRGKEFTEGWVEFAKKSVAKMVANMLNGEQIGGRRRSSHYYELWNIKYLHKFKWDNLTEEIAYKNAVREQKLAVEISAAKRERDIYLARVAQSRAIDAIEERSKKKQKMGDKSSDIGQITKMDDAQPKVIQHFPQRKSVSDPVIECAPRLSRDVLAGVFGHSSS